MGKIWQAENFQLISGVALALFMVNLLLIGWGLSTMSQPEHPLTREALEKTYDGQTLLDSRKEGRFRVLIWEAEEGKARVLVAQKRTFLDRYRILRNEEAELPISFTVDSGNLRLSLSIDETGKVTRCRTIHYGTPDVPKGAVTWSLALLALELAAWYIFDRIRNS